MLFKTALAGGDPNWGRIIARLGSLPELDCDFNRIGLSFGDHPIIGEGKLLRYSLKRAEKEFSKKNVTVVVDLKRGKASTVFYTTDLTKEYVQINSEYTT